MAAKPVAETTASNVYSMPSTTMPSLGETLDRRLGHVDQFYMRQIVGVEVVGIDTEPLAAEYILRAQQLRGRGILDDAADLLARELGDGVVGRLFEQQVAVGAEKGKPAALPRRLILLARAAPRWPAAPAAY